MILCRDAIEKHYESLMSHGRRIAGYMSGVEGDELVHYMIYKLLVRDSNLKLKGDGWSFLYMKLFHARADIRKEMNRRNSHETCFSHMSQWESKKEVDEPSSVPDTLERWEIFDIDEHTIELDELDFKKYAAALQNLSPPSRKLIKYLSDGYTEQEICKIMKYRDVRTVYQMKRRAIDNLKKEVKLPLSVIRKNGTFKGRKPKKNGKA